MTLSRLVALRSTELAQEAVRAALSPERFDVADAEGEEDPEAAWTLWLEVNGMKLGITSRPAPSLHSWHFEQPRWAPGEREAAESARFGIAVETELEEPPLRAFRDQLAVASALGEALYDESAARLIAPSQARRLVDGPLAPRELFSIHSVGKAAGDSFWVHTHGLARARVPELDLLSVPASGREAAGELLDATAALVLSHGVPPLGAPFPAGEGVELVLLPLEDALARAARHEPGGRESRDEEHREKERAVLAPASARSGGSPSVAPLLPRVSRAVLFRSPEDTERMRALARERWSDFERLFSAHRDDRGWIFLVKLGYEPDRTRDTRGDRGAVSPPKWSIAREHLWFRVRSLQEGRVEAVLESTPTDIASLERGVSRWHDLERLTDWLVVSPEGEIAPS